MHIHRHRVGGGEASHMRTYTDTGLEKGTLTLDTKSQTWNKYLRVLI